MRGTKRGTKRPDIISHYNKFPTASNLFDIRQKKSKYYKARCESIFPNDAKLRRRLEQTLTNRRRRYRVRIRRTALLPNKLSLNPVFTG